MIRVRIGKYVSPEELAAARERGWDALMEQARREATVNGDRRKVVGVRDAAGRWVYFVSCGSGCNVCDRREERARGGKEIGRG